MQPILSSTRRMGREAGERKAATEQREEIGEYVHRDLSAAAGSGSL